MEEAAAAELHLEVDDLGARLLDRDGLAAALVVAVALHVHHAVEVGITQVDLHQHTVSQTVHLKGRQKMKKAGNLKFLNLEKEEKIKIQVQKYRIDEVYDSKLKAKNWDFLIEEFHHMTENKVTISKPQIIRLNLLSM